MDRVANIIDGPTLNKPWALYHLLYFAYRYRFEYQYQNRNSVIGFRLPEYLLTGNAFNTTQIFLYNLGRQKKRWIKALGKKEYQFYVLKLRQQMKLLNKIYQTNRHRVFGINPKTGLVHPIDTLETQQMARDFNLIIKQFPFSLTEFLKLKQIFSKEAIFSILQGIQISDHDGGTTFLIKVKDFMVMYYEVPRTQSLDKRKVHVENKNVRVNTSSQSPNVDLQTHLFSGVDRIAFLYGELRLVGRHLQNLAKQKVQHK